MSDKITLDRETFKVLAADTRIEMLKRLAVHKLTLTDLATQMSMSPSTIKEHLDKLVETGLIEPDDKGMKWKYYRLTNKGRNIVSPQETKVWILLGTSLMVLAASILSLSTSIIAPDAMHASKALSLAPQAQAYEAQPGSKDLMVASKGRQSMDSEMSDDKYERQENSATPYEGLTEAKAITYPTSDSTARAKMMSAEVNPTNQSLADKPAENETNTPSNATSTAFEKTPRHTLSTISATTQPSNPQYLEVAIICVSLAVTGCCIGYLARNRICLR
jgi:DNA-binding transcriptional ArsR family regulator